MKNNPDDFKAFVRVLDVFEFDEHFSILVLEMGNALVHPDYKKMQDLYIRFFNDVNKNGLIYEDLKIPNMIVSNDGVVKITDLCGLQYAEKWKCLCDDGTLFTSWSASEPTTKATKTLAIQTMYFSMIMTDNVKKDNALRWSKNYSDVNLKNKNPNGFTKELLKSCNDDVTKAFIDALIEQNYDRFQYLFLNEFEQDAHLIMPLSSITPNDYYVATKKRKNCD